MKKQFKLPKEFAIKWLEALRSGNYKQCDGNLVIANDEKLVSEELSIENCSFCCLGVAGYIESIPISDMRYNVLLEQLKFSTKNVPVELLEIDIDYEEDEVVEENILTHILSSLNDGVNKNNYNTYFKHRKNLVYRHIDIHQHNFDEVDEYKLDFNQIADFIEDNCEFY